MRPWLATTLLILLAVPHQTYWLDSETARRGLLGLLLIGAAGLGLASCGDGLAPPAEEHLTIDVMGTPTLSAEVATDADADLRLRAAAELHAKTTVTTATADALRQKAGRIVPGGGHSVGCHRWQNADAGALARRIRDDLKRAVCAGDVEDAHHQHQKNREQ